MKKILAFILALTISLAAAGCSALAPSAITTAPSTEPPTQITTQTPTQEHTIELTEPTTSGIISIREPHVVVCVPPITESTAAPDGVQVFSYTNQSMSLILSEPEVAHRVTLEFLNRVDKATRETETVRQAALSDYNGSSAWTPYFCTVSYEPTRLDPGVLSLFGKSISSQGGRHPSQIGVSANYDLVTGETLTLGSILFDINALQPLIDLVVIALGKGEQAGQLYSDYPDTVTQVLSKNESFYENWYFTSTGLCFYFSPYEIAPYAAGIISVEIPYSDLPGILGDAYFPAERETAGGSLEAGPFDTADLTKYEHFSEAVLKEGGTRVLLTTETAVQNIRIQLDGQTIYYAYALSFQEAILLECTPEQLTKIQVVYDQNGRTTTLALS